MFNSNKETKEEKAARKEYEALEKYGLTTLSDPEDIDSVKKIISEMVGTGLMETGITLGGGNEKDILKVQLHYQRAILEQNFIMIRQLDKIATALESK